MTMIDGSIQESIDKQMFIELFIYFRNDDDFYGGQQKKKDHDSNVAGRSLWDAAKEIVASHQQRK